MGSNKTYIQQKLIAIVSRMRNKFIYAIFFLALTIFAAFFFLLSKTEQKCVAEGCNPTSECGWVKKEEMKHCPKVRQAGDTCARYAECKVVEGECKKVTQTEYQKCLDCLDECNVSPTNTNPAAYIKNCTCWENFSKDDSVLNRLQAFCMSVCRNCCYETNNTNQCRQVMNHTKVAVGEEVVRCYDIIDCRCN